MILEAATLDVIIGQEAAFEAAFAEARASITASVGYRSLRLQRCLEQENRYLLLVEWETLEAHTIGFRQSPAYQRWRALLHPFYDPMPSVLHYRSVAEHSLPAPAAA